MPGVPVDIEALAQAIDAELRAAGNAERAAGQRAYLKSTQHFYGATVPSVRATIAAVARAHPDLTHDELVDLAGVLWAEPVHERRLAGILLLDRRCDRLGVADAALLERLLRASRTWALVDALAVPVMGPLVDRCIEFGPVLDRWAVDEDFWLRRSALLALLVPLRHGRGDFDRFGRYADTMLDDREFFIRKAIGWVLRDTGRLRPDLVYDWLLPRAARASGVTVREAIKPLSEAQRAAIVAARRPA